ncbi:MAG: hypothetical protein ACHP7N_06955 [Caulobacterales bacterium]
MTPGLKLIVVAALALAVAAPAAGAGPKLVLHISSHLPGAAKVSIDGAAAITAPGEGSVDAPIAAGVHSLEVTAAGGVAYQGKLELKTAQLMRWHGAGYWCVNLLDKALEPYSKDECQEEVTDAG